MLGLIAWVVTVPPVLALGVFCVEVLAGLRPLPVRPQQAPAIGAVVLVPAHNEAATIETTIRGLREAIGHLDRLLVVADNCTDSTAEVARTAGAEVVERDDPDRRGKGFALAFGREVLSRDPPEVVVVVDADCTMSASSIERIVAAAASMDRPVQAVDLQVAPPGGPALVQISNLAMLIKNLVRARGLMRIGGGIPLFGTGMAIPWRTFATVDLATGETVEDLHLALELARDGIGVLLIENATVLSPAAAAADTLSQRRRWEHGFLHTAARQAVPLTLRGLKRRSRLQIALGLHLCVPPLALLITVSLLCGLVGLTLGTFGGGWTPPIVIFGALALALISTFVAWLSYGQEVLSASALATAPLYVARKLPLYLGAFTARQRVWNRTRRDGERG